MEVLYYNYSPLCPEHLYGFMAESVSRICGIRCAMKIICLGSSTSGLGKTTLCEAIIRRFHGLCALKVTTVKKVTSAEAPERCHAFPGESDVYHIEEDVAILSLPGKDTQRMIRAGALKVLWLTGGTAAMKSGLEDALARFGACPAVIIEGNTPMLFVHDAIKIIIAEPIMKESAEKIIPMADILLVRSSHIREFTEAHPEIRGRIVEYPSAEGTSQVLHHLQEFLESR